MKPLHRDRLRADPRVAQAKELLLAAISDAQAPVASSSAPDEHRVAEYASELERCGELRGGNLFYPYLGSGFGRGPLVELMDGSVKYDLIGGIGPNFWGHCHPDIVGAIIDVALDDVVMQGNLQHNIDSVRLLDGIIKLAQKNGAPIAHCFLSTSGAMANENALKLVLYHRRPRQRLLCFDKCFAGRSLALAAMTDKAAYRCGLPLALAVDYLPFYDANDPEGSTSRTRAALRAHLARFPEQHAAMCMELVQGEAGYFPGSTEFFQAVIADLRAAGIAIWIDEIQTFGRLNEPFAFQHFGLDNEVDVVTIGKMSQVCATLYTEHFKQPPGLLSQTFTASTAAIAASRVIVDTLLRGEFYGENGRIAHCHRRFMTHFTALSKRYPERFSGPFGIGAMIACTIGDGCPTRTKAFAKTLFENGVIGFIAGSNPTRLRFLPPVAALTDAHIDDACAIIGTTVEAFGG